MLLDDLKGKRVIISTLSPIGFGGVHPMTEFIVKTLKQRELEVMIAYYEPYRIDKSLSVPFFRILTGHPKVKLTEAYGTPSLGVGVWLPELEFTHYWPHKLWRDLIQQSDFHVCVSGSSLAALHFSLLKMPFLAWIATPFHEDREDRIKTFPWYRKILDFVVDRRISSYFEKKILRSGTILPLSNYTSIRLGQVSGRTFKTVLHMPIDTEKFSPDFGKVKPYLIGFVGRINDARKNIALLLKAAKICKKQGIPIQVKLIGEEPNLRTHNLICQADLENEVTCIKYMHRHDLVRSLQEMDVFVIPSYQEGLCIAGLEAMACGCPVISTRCGGTEDYVTNDENGYLVDFEEEEMAVAISAIITDRQKRTRMGKSAAETVARTYSEGIARQIFWTNFESAFGVRR